MDTIVTAPGSLGDVNPMLAIARQLQARGRSVIFLAAERYLPLATMAGLSTRALVSEERFARTLANPNIWKPMHGAKIILREVVGDYLEAHFDWLSANYQPGKTILVSHLLDFAGRVFRDRHPDLFMASVVLAPAVLRSKTQPPRLTARAWEPAIPLFLRPALYWLADRWIDSLAGKQVNRLRSRVGLAPVRNLINDWWLSPDLTIGMFPDWFSIPASDLPRQCELSGFPLADSGDLVPATELAELERVLAAIGGRPPIVFAPGTAHVHAGEFLNFANSVCEKLQQPGILISSAADQLPKQLTQGIITAKYLPFRRLLPHSTAIVHHGGVGTTSQSLAAGIPQLVLPMAFDQFDNAQRVQRLGCGAWFPMRKLTLDRLTCHLERILHRDHYHHSAKKIAQDLAVAPSGSAQAADTIMTKLNSQITY